jgi:hypothetical protein
MITPKIKALFQFIEYLYSNIDNFKQYEFVLNELYLLDDERQKLVPENNFKDKLKYNEIQEQIKNKFNVIKENIITPIKDKATELNICDVNNTETLWNWNISEIIELKENFSSNDVPEILSYKIKYIEYRTRTKGEAFFGLGFFFNDLDEILKIIFEYFKVDDKNEFEVFEAKKIQVENIHEAIEIFTDKPKKDTRYWLTNFFDKSVQNTPEHKSIKSQIDNIGWFVIKMDNETVKVYTPELAIILISKELVARNMETQTETYLNCFEHLQTYIEAYKEGEKYFENEFKVSPDTLYGANAEQYVKDIHLNYFHIQHVEGKEGWVFVKKIYPFILTHKEVKEFGYYSGIVNKVEEQVKKYPKLFIAFDKCEHNLPPEPIVKQKPELKIDQIALKYSYEGLQITRENGNEIAKKYGHNSGEKLFQRFTYFSSSANRKGKPNLCTPKKLDNKIKLIESIIELLPIDKQERAKDEVSILKKIYEAEYQ